MKYCSKCGKANKDDGKYCTSCGSPLRAPVSSVPAGTAGPKKGGGSIALPKTNAAVKNLEKKTGTDRSKKGEKKTVSADHRRKVHKRRLFLCIGAVAAVLALVVIAIVILRRPDPEQAFKDAVSQRIDNEIIFVDDPPLEYQYSNAILQALSYSIVSYDKDSATATIRFRYVDILALADELGDRELEADEYYTYCINAIQDKSAPYQTRTIVVRFEEQKINGEKQWIVVDDLELADILSGGTAIELSRILEGLA